MADDDIVTRLRYGVDGAGWSCDFSSEFDLIEEAAGEIERLRAAGDALVTAMRSGSDSGWDEVIDKWKNKVDV